MSGAAAVPPWWIPATWPAPATVRAGITTRRGGRGKPPFHGFNLALHVGDDAADIAANRDALRQGLALPAEPCWLEQVHGARVVDAAGATGNRRADGSHAALNGGVCAVMVADCVPLLLCGRDGGEVAAIHAGWRGIAAGVIRAGLGALAARPDHLLAWIGPCIGPCHYEVGADVRAACLAADDGASGCFSATTPGRWQADLRGLVHRQLSCAGVRHIHGADRCVFEDADHFYSHRRDGRTGRMAALIWITPAPGPGGLIPGVAPTFKEQR